MAFKAFVICIIVGLMVLTISAAPHELSPGESCPMGESFFDGCNVCLCRRGINIGCTKGPCPLSKLIPPSYEFYRSIARAIEKICAEDDPLSYLQCGYMFNKTIHNIPPPPVQ